MTDLTKGCLEVCGALLVMGAAYVFVPAPADPPPPKPLPPAHRDLCAKAYEWKLFMRENHPKVDRTIPYIAQRCGFADD